MATITKEWLQQTIAEFENTRDDIPFGLSDDDAKILIVLKRALASLEREQVRHEHAEWSDATFGDVGPIGPLKYLSKEALEAVSDPSDPLEWADMQFLLWDAQRRMGLSDEFITRAMIEKLEINKTRQWPEPKDGEPRLHIKEQPVPVVPEEMPKGLAGQIVSLLAHNIGDKFLAQKIWNACRAAMLHAGNFRENANSSTNNFRKITKTSTNSPVIPDSWKPAPEKADEDMIAEGKIMASCMIETVGKIDVSLIYGAMLAAAPEKESGPCTK
ncbi:DUF550 domain-containing protein [Salmonella enterica]|nr:DUF550 domain-containing protein [Salmonella enterica]EGL7480409.1 DUF550 domain-containing protein [Salmonella enterica]EIZ2335995.1 DUF550 domain-containing protein [Salmonella enterica]